MRTAQEEIHVGDAARHDEEHQDAGGDEGENECEQRATGERSAPGRAGGVGSVIIVAIRRAREAL